MSDYREYSKRKEFSPYVPMRDEDHLVPLNHSRRGKTNIVAARHNGANYLGVNSHLQGSLNSQYNYICEDDLPLRLEPIMNIPSSVHYYTSKDGKVYNKPDKKVFVAQHASDPDPTMRKLEADLRREPTSEEYWGAVPNPPHTTIGDVFHPRPLVALLSTVLMAAATAALVMNSEFRAVVLSIIFTLTMLVTTVSTVRTERDRRWKRMIQALPESEPQQQDQRETTSKGITTVEQRWDHVVAVKTELNEEWLSYITSPQRYYLDQPLLRDKTVPEVAAYFLAMELLTDAEQERKNIRAAERAATEAMAAWDTAQSVATKMGNETLGLTDTVALRRCAHILAQLENSETPPSAIPALVEQLNNQVAKLSERVRVSNDAVSRTLKKIELETGRAMLALEAGS